MSKKEEIDQPLLQIKVMTERVTKVHAEILVLGIFQDVRPLKGLAGEVDWIYNGIISHLILREKIFGRVGEATLLATQRKLPTPKILIMGLGKREKFTDTTFQEICEIALNTISQLQTKQCAMELFDLTHCALDSAKSIETFIRVMKPMTVQEGLELSLLVRDENKARQIQQRLSGAWGSA